MWFWFPEVFLVCLLTCFTCAYCVSDLFEFGFTRFVIWVCLVFCLTYFVCLFFICCDCCFCLCCLWAVGLFCLWFVFTFDFFGTFTGWLQGGLFSYFVLLFDCVFWCCVTGVFVAFDMCLWLCFVVLSVVLFYIYVADLLAIFTWLFDLLLVFGL